MYDKKEQGMQKSFSDFEKVDKWKASNFLWILYHEPYLVQKSLASRSALNACVKVFLCNTHFANLLPVIWRT